MTNLWKSTTENQVTVLCIISGIAIAFLLAPKDSYLLMFSNVGFFWLPQAIVLYIFIPSSSRSAVISGTAIVLSLYLAVFGTWIFSRQHPDSMAWLGYIFSLPGAGVGTLIGTFFIKQRNFNNAIVIGVVSALFTLVGLLVNQTIICGTVLYCGI